MYHLVYDEDILRDESKCDHCGGGVWSEGSVLVI